MALNSLKAAVIAGFMDHCRAIVSQILMFLKKILIFLGCEKQIVSPRQFLLTFKIA